MKAKIMRVKDLMKSDIQTTSKATELRDAIKIMRSMGVSSLIVEPDDDMDAFGIITRKDVVEVLVENEMSEDQLLVEDAMTKPAITISPEMSIYNCHQFMRMVGVRRMPVVDGSILCGIISNSDIFAMMVEALEIRQK